MKTHSRAWPLLGAVLLHPMTVLAASGAGIYVGWYHHHLASYLALPGIVYLRALYMCVLPLIISATILSVARLLTSPYAGRTLVKLFGVFICGMLIASIVGVVGAKVGAPGRGLQQEQKVLLGREIMRLESAGTSEEEGADKGSALARFLKEAIPENVFKEASEGRSLPVLVFCVILGIALGALRTTSSATAIAVVDAVYESLLKIVSWLMYGLPVGLFCLLADQMSLVGAGVFAALFKLVLWMSIACLALIAFYILIIWRRARCGLWETLMAMKQAALVAWGTSSSLAAIPSVLKGLHGKLGFQKEMVDLVIPLGTTLNPHGNMVCFSMMALFVAQLYDVSFSMGDIVTILIAAVLAGVAASSAPGMAAVAMVAMVLEPFGLPLVIGIVVLTAINPLVDPLLTLVSVLGNSATAALVADRVSVIPVAAGERAEG